MTTPSHHTYTYKPDTERKEYIFNNNYTDNY
jgi:hypothetical protein